MFRCTTVATSYRAPPPDEPFVFDPDVHDDYVVVATVVQDVTAGRGLLFTIRAFGREVTFDDGLELTTLLGQLSGMIDALSSGTPGEFDIMFHDQGGLILTLRCAVSGDEVTVTGDNPSRELIPRGAHPPVERLSRAALAAELRQVARDVVAAGAAAGSEFVRHPVFEDWARRVGAAPPAG